MGARALLVRPIVLRMPREGRARWPLGLAWLLLASAVIAALSNLTWERGWEDWLIVAGMFVLAGIAMWNALRERRKRRVERPD
jgi:ABC-type polysaccharide/polyol phosphate export permease